MFGKCQFVKCRNEVVQVIFPRVQDYHEEKKVLIFLPSARSSYVPSQQDILYCRKKTTAIHEFNLDIEGVPFLFVDVGGQVTDLNY